MLMWCGKQYRSRTTGSTGSVSSPSKNPWDAKEQVGLSDRVESSGVSDDEICHMIHDEVAAVIQEAIPEDSKQQIER